MKYFIIIFFFCLPILARGQGYDTCSHLRQWESANPQPGDQLVTKKNNGNILSLPEKNEWADTCSEYGQWMSGMMSTQEDYKHQYDTLKLFVEHCCPIMPGGDIAAGEAFSILKGAVQFYSDDTSRYYQYRQWLISVVFINPSDKYFCAWLGAIRDAYVYYHCPHIINEPLTIAMFAQKHGCGDESKFISQFIAQRHKDWKNDHNIGIDTLPEDTTVPSMADLGLGFLDTLKAGVTSSTNFISTFTTNPNPFTKETTLEFTLNRMAYTTVAVYDELGRIVWGDSHGASLEAGKHTIHLDGSKWESGVYYARISTGFGEVKTVKLIRE